MAYKGLGRSVTDDYSGDDDSSITKGSFTTMSKASSIHGQSTERSPLLKSSSQGATVIELPPHPKHWLHGRALKLTLILVVFLAGAGSQLMETPQTRIIESVMCYRYYEKADPSKILAGRQSVGPGAVGGVAEADCKVDAVQSELAMLRGYQQMLDGLPALLLAIPFGWAADRYGRKPLLTIGLMSFIFRAGWIQFVTWFWQAFDIRMTWLSSLHALVSGSDPVVSGLLFVVLSDITPESERAAIFLRVGAANLVGNIIMPPLSAWLMQYNPWIPSLAGTLITVLVVLPMPFIPETLNYRQIFTPAATHPPTPSAETAPDLAGVPEPTSADFAVRMTTKIKDSTRFLTQDWRVPALILPFLCHTLIGSATILLVQYISKRFNTTFSKATLVMTIYSTTRVVLLFLILPYVSKLVMRHFQLSNQQKDLYLTRASQLFVVVGWTLVGLSPNIPAVALSMAVASLGQGTYLLARSFLTSLVEAHHIARVYSIITVVDTVGAMFGGPLLAALFKSGLDLGGCWVGMPFYFIGVVSAAFAVLMFVVRLRPGEGKLQLEDEE